MSKDAADNPYLAQLRPFVLPCAECGEVGPVVELRNVEGGTYDTPPDPLCRDCSDIHLRVWGAEGLSNFSTHGERSSTEDGLTLYYCLCSRCNGSGRVEPWGACKACAGLRYELLDPKGVRRTARWWQTYQQNRTKP